MSGVTTAGRAPVPNRSPGLSPGPRPNGARRLRQAVGNPGREGSGVTAHIQDMLPRRGRGTGAAGDGAAAGPLQAHRYPHTQQRHALGESTRRGAPIGRGLDGPRAWDPGGAWP